MIRQPTPDPYRWHRAAMAGHEPPIDAESPQCGWFRRRLVKGGVLVPARIWLMSPVDYDTGELEDDERLFCEVAGRPADPYAEWPWLAGDPIPESEFRYLTATMDWSRAHAPHEPFANPHRAVNWRDVPIPTF